MRISDDQSWSASQGWRSFTKGLSGKLLFLTVLFIVLAEILILVPSIANMRVAWLSDRINTAVGIGRLIDGIDNNLPAERIDAEMRPLGIDFIALSKDGVMKTLASVSDPRVPEKNYDLRDVTGFQAIYDAIDTLFHPTPRMVRVVGYARDNVSVIEVIISSKVLRDAMLRYINNVAFITLALSAIIGSMIFVSFNYLFVKPIRRLTAGMVYFAEEPNDPRRLFQADDGADEIAVAGQHLAQMQTELSLALRHQKNLVDLGLGVSKINHDLRNILSSAQLMSDRLVDVADPTVRSLAPRLIRTLDRAVNYTNELLEFGRPQEALTRRINVPLAQLIKDVREVVLLNRKAPIGFNVAVSDEIFVPFDPDQLFRVIYNLTSNAAQALESDLIDVKPSRRLTVSAERSGKVVIIIIDDNGPGMPVRARENLFSAFKSSTRAGGTGLGLVIARELLLTNGGTINLVEKDDRGTRFRIEIPTDQI